jgi:hypothetical protein
MASFGRKLQHSMDNTTGDKASGNITVPMYWRNRLDKPRPRVLFICMGTYIPNIVGKTLIVVSCAIACTLEECSYCESLLLALPEVTRLL